MKVVASVAPPWEASEIRVEKLESPKPFTFTHRILEDALTHSSAEPAGRSMIDEAVIATTLNGYETRAPFGRTRAPLGRTRAPVGYGRRHSGGLEIAHKGRQCVEPGKRAEEPRKI